MNKHERSRLWTEMGPQGRHSLSRGEFIDRHYGIDRIMTGAAHGHTPNSA